LLRFFEIVFSGNAVTILFSIFILSQICDNFIFKIFFVTDLWHFFYFEKSATNFTLPEKFCFKSLSGSTCSLVKESSRKQELSTDTAGRFFIFFTHYFRTML